MDELTKKQKGFVKDYVKTGIGSMAIKKNYDVSNDETARSMATENLTKPHIIKAIKSIADSIPDDKLSKVLLEGLDAGRQTQEGIDPDYAVRHKYLDTALKLKGSYDEKGNINILMPILVKFLNEKDDTSNG